MKSKLFKRFQIITIAVVIFSWTFVDLSRYLGNWIFKPYVAHAATVPNGVIIAWPGTDAAVASLSGWSRVTALDTYFLEGTTSDPSASAFGSPTHTHLSSSHTHTTSHAHTSAATGNSADSSNSEAGSGGQAGPHSHTAQFIASSGTNNSTQADFTTNPVSSEPPFTKVIFIQSDGTPTGIPDGAWVFFNSDTLPTNWSRVSGNRFLQGADASGDGGSTGGSSDSHTHVDAGHTHTEGTHQHSASTQASGAGAVAASGGGGASQSSNSHTHAVTGGSTTATEPSGTGVVNNDDGQPPFYKLNIIQNDTGGLDLPDNIITMWTGTIASKPSTYDLCDGGVNCPNLNDKFIKGSNADSELGNTGGALTHTHTAGTAHDHTINSHTHTYTVVGDATGAVKKSKSGNAISDYVHTHTLSTTEGGGLTGTQTLTALANSDNRPDYKEVAFIEYDAAAVGSLTLTASSSQSFDVEIIYKFTAQTSTASDVGAISMSDDRVGAPGWTLDLQAIDWCKENTCGIGDPQMQLDYDGTGFDDDLGKLCVFPNDANLYAQSGSLTGVTKQSNACFSSGVTTINLVTATSGNGTGAYWLTDMSLEQYIPSAPTVQVYTTTITFTLSYHDPPSTKG